MSYRNSHGTIIPQSRFDPKLAASSLDKAIKDGDDGKKQIRGILTSINNQQRQKVREQYQELYGKDLVEELKKEYSGDFEHVILALMEPPIKFDAIHLHRAIKGVGTTETVLIDILCTRSSQDLEKIKNAYSLLFGKSLEDDVIGDTSGDFQQLLVGLLECTRDQSDGVDVNAAREDAKRMLGNKLENLKPDKEAFKFAFTSENYQQLEALFDEYQLLSGHSIQKGIEEVFTGDARKAYLAIVDAIHDTPKYFARRLHDSMRGLGTDDLELIGIVVSRSEIDLAEIKVKFERKYHKPLVEFIKSDCSEAYSETLITIVNGNRQVVHLYDIPNEYTCPQFDNSSLHNDDANAVIECQAQRTKLLLMTETTTMSGQSKCRGTVTAQVNFSAQETAAALEKAMKGWGCDKQAVLKEITRINNAQRQLVRDFYKRIYEKDLIDELKRELSGDFENIIIGLMEIPIKYDAIQLYQAMKGLGTRESTLIDIICTRTDPEKQALKKVYEEEFGRSLEADVIDDTSGEFQHLLVSLLQCHRDKSAKVNERIVTEDALLLMGSRKNNIKPDISTFNCAFSSQSFKQLRKLFDQYKLFTDETIQDCIRKTFSGDAKAAYLAVADCIENRPKYFARRLCESMKGIGTSDCDLIYIIVSRSEIDLANIKEEFDATYENTLIEWIKSDCSGAYRDALIAIVNGNS
uniref:Annexin n=1 Tax=Ascaris lumbricoides TaxID=6252 RepID=A0A0M3HZY6_ASCLU